MDDLSSSEVEVIILNDLWEDFVTWWWAITNRSPYRYGGLCIAGRIFYFKDRSFAAMVKLMFG